MEEHDQLTFDEFNPSNKELGTKRGLVTNTLTKDKLIDLYHRRNKSLQDIAKEYNCTRQMVKLLMEKYGIYRRKRSEARLLAIKEGKFKNFEYDPINENFFSAWTPQMAWVLGLLFTDGYISQNMHTGTGVRVSISSMDFDLLEKIKRCLNSTRTIKKNIQSYDKSKYIYQFEFYRAKMFEDLIYLGLFQRKSLNMQFPEVPESYMRHFIRGCWDGDGSVYIDKDGKLNSSYVSGAKEFMEYLVETLYKAGIHRKKIVRSVRIKETERLRSIYPIGKYPLNIHIEKRSKSPSYSIKLNSRENMETMFYYFYAGVGDSMYLKRKYDVFVKGLNLAEEELTLQSESKFEYTSTPIRPFSIEPRPNMSREKIWDVILSIEERTNKKVLTINNSDGKLKCFKCREVPETIYVISQPYCAYCLSNSDLNF